MARILKGIGFGDIKGSVGALTFSSSLAGTTIRVKPRPVRRGRRGQPSQRSRITYLSRYWGSLSAAIRSSWETWAIDHPEPDGFGGTFIMSGINAFVKLNIQAMRLFGPNALQDLPPTDPPASSPNVLTAVTGITLAGDIDLSWTEDGAGIAADLWEIQQAGPFQSPGMQEVWSKFRHVASIAGNVLLETISGLDEGMWYWFRIRYVDQYGQTTPFVVAQATPMLTP